MKPTEYVGRKGASAKALALLLICALSLNACRPAARLAPGSWDPAVRKALNALMRDNAVKTEERDNAAKTGEWDKAAKTGARAEAGKANTANTADTASKTNTADTKPSREYAVFDFDKTTAVHDVSQALWVYQVEHLRFADAPAHGFLDGVPDPSREVAPGVTFADMGAALKEEYTRLTQMRNAGASWEEVHGTDDYLDFRARMFSLLAGLDGVFGGNLSYLWMPGLLTGFTPEEARTVVREAIEDQYGRDKLGADEWRSPDGRWGGVVERGIWVSPEMKDLYRCLEAHGIDTYVCSASLELVVEVLAGDPELGVGLPPERVFGLRFAPGDTLKAVYDPTYIQPIKAGKVACINAWMAPAHGGRGPVLVGGDSNGDVPMLTGFPETVHGLVIDVGRRPDSAIGELAAEARAEQNTGRNLLQPAFAPVPEAVEGGGI